MVDFAVIHDESPLRGVNFQFSIFQHHIEHTSGIVSEKYTNKPTKRRDRGAASADQLHASARQSAKAINKNMCKYTH